MTRPKPLTEAREKEIREGHLNPHGDTCSWARWRDMQYTMDVPCETCLLLSTLDHSREQVEELRAKIRDQTTEIVRLQRTLEHMGGRGE